MPPGTGKTAFIFRPPPAITSSSILLGTAMHTGGLAADGTYNGSADGARARAGARLLLRAGAGR